MPVKTDLHGLKCSQTSLGPILNINIWFEGRVHYVCVTIADNGEYKANNESLHLFNAKIGHCYSCRNESVYMGNGLYLEVTQDRMQAFNLTKGNEFGSRKCLSKRKKWDLRAFYPSKGFAQCERVTDNSINHLLFRILEFSRILDGLILF